MYNILNKYKRILILIVKLLIVAFAVYYLVHKLMFNDQILFHQFKNQLSVLFASNIWLLVLLLIFTDANWIIEIIKWQKLVLLVKKISFFEAYEQCFGSLTVSIITPNRVGEYGAKSLYFKKEVRKKIILLNFIGNMGQLSTTVLFGIVGILFLIFSFNIQFPEINIVKVAIGLILLLVCWMLCKKWMGNKIREILTKIPQKIYLQSLGFSFLRYLIFLHQFVFLLYLFNVNINYFTAVQLLFCMYFFASIIPSLSLFDWVIKGSVAVWLFGLVQVNEVTILTITMVMWILNFAIPALLGSVFVLNFNFDKEK